WKGGTKTLADAIVNNNRILAEMGGIQKDHKVLDAGCGVGGGSIYIAKNIGAQCTGITLSAKQVESANRYAAKNGVSDKVHFEVNNYFETGYPDESFDIAWAMESMATAPDKERFLKEMYRVLKPGGKLLIADIYKTSPYDVAKYQCMYDMLHHWAISDILTVEGNKEIARKQNFEVADQFNATSYVKRSVNRIYYLSMLGMLGTKLYELRNPKVSGSSKNHYKTGFGQYHGYKKRLWEYHLWVLRKPVS
ncbi:MAG: methyltransferase domain-containing protein, partial [Owenweeksia sp.]